LVGLCWRSTSPANGVMKSIPLETLAGALAIPGVRLLSLQYGDTRGERDALRRATGLEVVADPEIDTFHDIDNLAALIAACDVVVSVSNTTAHLAGALGQPTWLLIDSRLDWRWGLTDSDTLCQGRAVERLANSKNRVARCCAISYALAADDVLLASARAMESAFAEADLQANGLLGGHFAYCFYAWFDEGPREQVFAELLAEVRHNIADRQRVKFEQAAADLLAITADEHILAGAA
jgi:hypothetical protein